MNLKVLKRSASAWLLTPPLVKVAVAANTGMTTATDCHNRLCKPLEEYCSQFEQNCLPCTDVCNPQHIIHDSIVCSRECGDYIKIQPLTAEIHNIQMQQNIILVLLILLLLITSLHYIWKCIKWLKDSRCILGLMKKFKSKKVTHAKQPTHINGKEAGTTIQNMCAIERAPSQMYSLTGAEGSVMTVTTPISSRHPAENTTPSPQSNEYSYDNQALSVTPVSEKPSGAVVF